MESSDAVHDSLGFQGELWRQVSPDPPAPLHSGHRERLRERAAGSAFAGMPDYEVLELFLFRSRQRGDVKPTAKALIQRFGSLAGIASASLAELKSVKGVGEATALDLKVLHEMTLRIARQPVVKRPVISSWTALLAYVRVALADQPREQFRVLFLDKKNQLIADETMNHGTVDHAAVYPREVVRRALELSSSAIILLHNHPTWPFRSRSITSHHIETQELLGLP